MDMSNTAITMSAPASVFRRRRAALGAQLRRPLVILAGHARARNYLANTYPFRAGSNYLYFGGPPMEGAAWIIEPGCDGDKGCVLLRMPQTVDDAVWTGEMAGDDAIAAAAGIPESALHPPNRLTKLLGDRKAVFVAPPCPVSERWMADCKIAPADDADRQIIIAMRLGKDENEQTAMRRAADATVQAHLAAMRACRPGRSENDVVAALLSTYVAHRCETSFTPIVTIHGEVLHPHSYGHALEPGRLLLVDSGGEEHTGYACDVTRTYPVSGTWNSLQGQLYDVVVRAEQAAIDACVPGKRYRDVHDIAAREICAGLIDVGLLRGNVDSLLERRAHTLFFVHGIGHLIGLDVHDMEDFGDFAGYAPGRTRRPGFGDKFLRLDRDLAPGFGVTIEPGIYVVPAIWRNQDMTAPFADVVNRPLVEQLLAAAFGGIRVEDTVLVRAGAKPVGQKAETKLDGPEVLTAALPKTRDALSAMVGGG